MIWEQQAAAKAEGRTPQGVRGLKCPFCSPCYAPPLSHPARGAWIEMAMLMFIVTFKIVAPRKGCVD